MSEKNPFKKEDGFIEIIKANPKIKALSEFNYKQFIQKNTMSSNNPTTSSYLKFVHFITKNAFVSTLVMLLVLGTLGVSAAQVFAPEENKPSTLFGAKKSSSSSSSSQESSFSSSQASSSSTNFDSNISPILQGDNENDVTLVEKCDLQFKYPKFSTNQGMQSKATKITKNDTGIELFYEFEFGSGPAHDIFIDCEPEVLTLQQYEAKSNNNLTGDPNGIGKPSVIDISSQDLCSQIGLASNSCDKISNSKKIIRPTPESNLITYYFSGEGKTFRISSYIFFKDDTNPEFAAKYKTKTAFQFNSLSEPKMEVKEVSTNPLKEQQSTKSPYTNSFFPNFKIVYPDGWKFETSTQTSAYDGLLKREITLTKNQYQIKLNTRPNDNYDSCEYGTIKPPFEMNNEKFANGISKFTLTQNNKKYIVYGENKGIGCRENKILLTNLKASQYPKYLQTIQSLGFIDNKEFVSYSVDITVSSDNGKTDLVSSNDPIITELDQILSQSSFN